MSVYSLHLVTNVLEDVDVEPLDVLVPPVLVPLLATVPIFHLKVMDAEKWSVQEDILPKVTK